MVHDKTDPTMALFTSMSGAVNAAARVMIRYPKTVQSARAKAHYKQGQLMGYKVIANKTDGSGEPITNSDVERLEL